MQIKTNAKAGFTLVEIMIVVAIIGLLAAIAIPNFVKARENAQLNSIFNNLRIIEGAKDQWALENKKGTGDTVGIDIQHFRKIGRQGDDAKLLVGSPFEPAGGIIGTRAEEMSWPRAVRPGDELRVEGEILEVRSSRSRPEHGFVKAKSTTLNQRDEAVQVLVMNMLVKTRAGAGA